MASTVINQVSVLDIYAALPLDQRDLLIEIATNYMFDMAQQIGVSSTEIDQKDRLYKALDFLAQGWQIENAFTSQWRYSY